MAPKDGICEENLYRATWQNSNPKYQDAGADLGIRWRGSSDNVRTHAWRRHADAGGLGLPQKILKSRCSEMRFQANPDDIK
jgi:hypothetical protein